MSTAIVTGASSGIGKEFAKGLVKRGINEIWLVARREDRLISLGEELGIKYKVIAADLCKSEGIDLLKNALKEEKPSVKYLVNAAGFGDFGAFDEMSEEDTARMIDLNAKALTLITHFTLPFMERGGRIVQLGSGSAFTPLPYFNVYAATKAYVVHYTKALNYELKKYGVRATCFCPGWVHTEFIDKATAEGGKTQPDPKKLRPLLNCEKVVTKALRAMDKGKAVFRTGIFTKLQHILYKLVPTALLSRSWLMMSFSKKQLEEQNGESKGKYSQ